MEKENNKIIGIIAVIVLCVVMLSVPWFIFASGGVRHGREFVENITIHKTSIELRKIIEDFRTSLSGYPELRNLLDKAKYEKARAREQIAWELQSAGFSTTEITVREPESGAVAVGEFASEFLDVTVRGSIDQSQLNEFVIFLSTREQIWGIRRLSISPKVPAVDYLRQIVSGRDNSRLSDELSRVDFGSPLSGIEMQFFIVTK